MRISDFPTYGERGGGFPAPMAPLGGGRGGISKIGLRRKKISLKRNSITKAEIATKAPATGPLPSICREIWESLFHGNDLGEYAEGLPQRLGTFGKFAGSQ